MTNDPKKHITIKSKSSSDCFLLAVALFWIFCYSEDGTLSLRQALVLYFSNHGGPQVCKVQP